MSVLQLIQTPVIPTHILGKGRHMYWLKTKIKHILYHNFTDKEFSRFMKIRALTCQLGHMPNDKQIASICPQKTYQNIVKALASEGQSIGKVLAKDIEDAGEVLEKRDQWKIKKRQQREKHKDVQVDSPNLSNHREDKSIEEKITTTEAVAVYNHFSNNIHLITPVIKDSIDSYLVDTPPDWIKMAIDEGAKNNARSWRYIEAIVKTWKEKGKVSAEKTQGNDMEKVYAIIEERRKEREDAKLS